MIHFVWTDEPLPDWAAFNIAEFERLNGEVAVHTDDAMLLPQYRDLYESSCIHMQRSDWLRASILEQLGGWYFDCDCFPVRPLPSMDVGDMLACLCWDTGCLNAMMYCEAGCPVWSHYAPDDVGGKYSGSHALNRVYRSHPHLFAPLAREQWTGGRLDPINYDLAHSGQGDRMMVPAGQFVIHGT